MTETTIEIRAALAEPPEPLIPEPGIHRDVPYEVYHRWRAANHSVLKLFSRSAAHAREEMLHPQDPSEAKAFGHAAHMAILEPERFEQEVVLGLELPRRSNADKARWAEFEAANRGRLIVSREELDCLIAMKEAVWSHPACRKFIAAPGLNEVSFVWVDPRSGVLCKAREDMLREVDGWPWLINLKSTKNAAKGSFARDVYFYQYHSAAAFYIDGMKALGQDGVRFAFLPIEKERPFGCTVYELDDVSIDQGRSEYRQALIAFKECSESGVWPGYGDLDYIGIPHWAIKGYSDGD